MMYYVHLLISKMGLGCFGRSASFRISFSVTQESYLPSVVFMVKSCKVVVFGTSDWHVARTAVNIRRRCVKDFPIKWRQQGFLVLNAFWSHVSSRVFAALVYRAAIMLKSCHRFFSLHLYIIHLYLNMLWWQRRWKRVAPSSLASLRIWQRSFVHYHKPTYNFLA